MAENASGPLTTEEVAQAVGIELAPLPVADEDEAAVQMVRLLRYLRLPEWNVQEFVRARYPNAHEGGKHGECWMTRDESADEG